MASDDNQDLENKDEETTEGEEEDTSTDGEQDDADGTAEDTDADTEGDEGDGEGDGEDDADFVIPDKFKGKDAKAIAKSYVELEGMIQKKATDLAREMIGKNRPGGKTDKGDDEAIKKAMEGVDFTKMKPEEFAAWLIKTVEARAQEIARNTYESADSTKAQVQTEIATVTKSWPQLKENEGFRNMVLALIENAAGKGEILPLKEACAKVGKAMGLKPGQKPAAGADEGKDGTEGEGEGKKRPKTGVERQGGSGGSDSKQTDEEKVLEGLMGGANRSGGLGSLI